ncbi:FxsA family protein [Cognatishimia activa]|uniref:Suppressor of F exclusion of phage T7 n=1 Tax=Cognatishimia activa TaxID=1715691 RepID=A0A0N7MB68_9RHOB|nr:FxsA family protein [Cognatishimia activa]CUI41118.1 Suppressor of F exclusion of phage T7 [Cognatishimia activa]CUK24568.1 Suppressor of F exclusion of phage T7 [Cognatishimia activa]
MWLFLAFLAVPLIEIGLFIQVGGAIGLFPTLGIVVLTAILGTWLVRNQGAMALGDLRKSFNELNDPTEPLAHGAMILFSGALLLTPGFFTDAVGFALLMPPVRVAIMNYVRKRVHVQRFDMGGAQNRHAGFQDTRQADETVIDGEFSEVDPSKKPTHETPKGTSGWTKH